MGEAAVAAAQAVGYVGAGTVEFLSPTAQFYFMEMNTRLQVEHPVTEMITGLDLVEWQLRVASGEPLPLRPGRAVALRPRDRGAALRRGPGARLPAVDRPHRASAPGPAPPTTCASTPACARATRSPSYYDPMIAKLIAWGEDRAAAAQRLAPRPDGDEIAGLATNAAFLSTCWASRPSSGPSSTPASSSAIAPTCCRKARARRTGALALAAAFLVLSGGARAAGGPARRRSAFALAPPTAGGSTRVRLRSCCGDNAGRQRDARLTFSGELWTIAIDDGAPLRLTAPRIDNGSLVAGADHGRLRVTIVQDGNEVTVIERGRATRVGAHRRAGGGGSRFGRPGRLTARCPARSSRCWSKRVRA